MEQSPSWEANSHSTRKEISRPEWNTKVQKNQSMDPILSQLNPVHNNILVFKTHFNIILPFSLNSPFKLSD
jgi:hypothetical protein